MQRSTPLLFVRFTNKSALYRPPVLAKARASESSLHGHEFASIKVAGLASRLACD